MKVYLFNDTSNCHSGCRAVMRSLRYALREHEIIAVHRVGETHYDQRAMDACDIVFVNGEGTLHHRAPKGDFLMSALGDGQATGKVTMLVNALIQQDAPYFNDTIKRLDFFSVRDPRSLVSARKCGGSPVLLTDSCADPCFLRGRKLRALPEIVKGDTHPVSPAHGVLGQLPFPHFGLNVAFEDCVATLAQAKLYITGQHHGIYAAVLAGIPFVPLVSNSHKIEALVEWGDLPIKVCRKREDVIAQMDVALANPQAFKRLRERIMDLGVFRSEHLAQALSRLERKAPPVRVCFPATAAAERNGEIQRVESAAQRLRRVVAQRPIAVLLHGPSIKTLEQRVGELADLDVCYASLNFFKIMETNILDRIGQELDFVYCSSEEELPRRLRDIEEFLSRSPDKVLITKRGAVEGLGNLVRRFRGQILFVERSLSWRPKMTQEEFPNSLTWMLQLLATLEMSPRILLFGADGLVDKQSDARDAYYGKETLRKEGRDCCLINDTIKFNTQFTPQMELLYKTRGVARPEILNCNPDTYLTPLPIIDYDEVRNRIQQPLPDRSALPLDATLLEQNERDVDAFLADPFSNRARHMRNPCEGFKVVLHQGFFYGFAPHLGDVDFDALTDADIKDYALRESCFIAESMDALREKILIREDAKRSQKTHLIAEESGVSVTIHESPIVLSEDTNGYVTFAFGDRFYALAHEIMDVNLSQISEKELAEHTERGLFHQANTLGEIQAAIATPRPEMCVSITQ